MNSKCLKVTLVNGGMQCTTLRLAWKRTDGTRSVLLWKLLTGSGSPNLGPPNVEVSGVVHCRKPSGMFVRVLFP